VSTIYKHYLTHKDEWEIRGIIAVHEKYFFTNNILHSFYTINIFRRFLENYTYVIFIDLYMKGDLFTGHVGKKLM